MTSLWGGRFAETPDQLFARYNASFRFDFRLLAADITGSRAYAKALMQVGVLSPEECQALDQELKLLAQQWQQNPEFLTTEILSSYEDVHSFVESHLTQKLGNLGKKLHTGRSRNDQVATDLRLFLREELDGTVSDIKALQGELLSLAKSYPELAMPGYTHLQKAQPILFAHFLLSFFEMLQRDKERLIDLRRRLNRLPLGSGALSGNSMGVDRHFLARELGFEDLCWNSLDAVADRDFAVEFLAAASLSMMHLSRLSEDLILYSSDEFQFVRMGDAVSTGSSLMPQKKNPDALELIRGKSGRTYGSLISLLTVLKGLPSCYNKDMQEDKEALFNGLDTWRQSLQVMKLVLQHMSIQSERMLSEAEKAYMNATELADYLVGKGLAFRDAHHLVGEIVVFAIKKQKALHELTIEDFQGFYQAIQQDVYQALSLEQCLRKKSSLGGTAPHRVAEALARAESLLI